MCVRTFACAREQTDSLRTTLNNVASDFSACNCSLACVLTVQGTGQGYENKTGTPSDCIICPVGKYNDAIAGSCQACADNKMTAGPGSISADACVCKVNLYCALFSLARASFVGNSSVWLKVTLRLKTMALVLIERDGKHLTFCVPGRLHWC